MTAYTVDDLNAHLDMPVGPARMKEQSDRIVCADGFSVSVQASRTHYSMPRDNDGPYTHVECGYARYPEGKSPLAPDTTPIDDRSPFASFDKRRRDHRHEYVFVEEWREWAEDTDRGDTVYGFVPVEAVVAWINAHGGVSP